METVGAVIVTLIINMTVGGAIGALFSATRNPQEPPREEQTVSREAQTTDAPHDIAPDEAQPNETPSAEDR